MNDGRRLRERVEAVLDKTDRVAVAVSGGVDSLTLATIAGRMQALEADMVHAVSPAVPRAATARVRDHAEREGWRLRVLDAGEFDEETYRANPVDRCLYCKRSLYGAIRRVVPGVVLSGTNADDPGDYRPGLAAAAEHGVRHPYVEAGVDKRGVRAIARGLGLGEVAELPASPCLASRIETGIRIEPELLAFVERAERAVREALAPRVVRARVRRDGLVIELDPAALDRLSGHAGRDLARTVRALAPDGSGREGVRFAAYRMGSAFLHDRLPAGDRGLAADGTT